MTHPSKKPTFKTLEDMFVYVHQGKIAETHDVQINLVLHKEGESLDGYIDGERMLHESVMDPGLLVVRLLRIAGVQSERKGQENRGPVENAQSAQPRLDMLTIARRWGAESLAFTPEQAWSDVIGLIPKVVTKEDVQQLVTRAWNLSATVPRRSAEHYAKIAAMDPTFNTMPAPLPLGVIISGERIAEAEPTSNPTPDWAGRTMVVREPSPGSDKDPSGGPIRYVEITSIDGPSASGTWKHGDHHVFCRYSGRCIESSNGAMDGWMIAPYEMRRHLGHEHTKKQEV